MPVIKATEVQSTKVRDGVSRILLHTENLMMVSILFDNGPWKEPDPFHHHVHEQTTYIAEGEILFLCEGEKNETLKAGDMFSVSSSKPHAIQLLSDRARLIDSFTPVREDFL